MKAVGIILGVVVAGLAAYIIWGMFGNNTANAATLGSKGVAPSTGSNWEIPPPPPPPPGWDPYSQKMRNDRNRYISGLWDSGDKSRAVQAYANTGSSHF